MKLRGAVFLVVVLVAALAGGWFWLGIRNRARSQAERINQLEAELAVRDQAILEAAGARQATEAERDELHSQLAARNVQLAAAIREAHARAVALVNLRGRTTVVPIPESSSAAPGAPPFPAAGGPAPSSSSFTPGAFELAADLRATVIAARSGEFSLAADLEVETTGAGWSWRGPVPLDALELVVDEELRAAWRAYISPAAPLAARRRLDFLVGLGSDARVWGGASWGGKRFGVVGLAGWPTSGSLEGSGVEAIAGVRVGIGGGR